jgi:hypothetical protein
LLRSLLTVVLTKSINLSTDFISLQRSGPSGVASMLGSHAVKHSAVIWKEYGIQTQFQITNIGNFDYSGRIYRLCCKWQYSQTRIRRHEKDCKFVSLYTNDVVTEDYNVMVNSEELIGNTEYLTL